MTTARLTINLEERVTIRLTDAGLKVLQERGYPSYESSTFTCSLRELFKLFGLTFAAERNPYLFEGNDIELYLGR